uniref:Myc box-dependent-interacting protein 1-like isoform X2 n=1 Tax=Petromyzon marinus TaxID=7757 RepID=A0AAJ7WWL3_PETMA|nr:myc box-dependent-interacting protein 1-like isoform X2 [Petromyzon marinus]
MAEGSPRAALFARNVHKHWSRAHEKVLQRLGKADETRDEQFEQLAQNFAQQQTESSRLNRDLRAYLASIKALHESSGRLWESLLLLSEEDWPERETLSCIAETTELLWEDYHQKLWDQTLPALETHQAPFGDVKARMSKRARKLVDVDGARHHLQALQAGKKRDEAKISKAEEDLQKAQRVFEEINSELQDELPALFTSRVGVYVNTLQSMAGVEENVYRELSKLSKQLYEVMHKASRQHHASQSNTRPPRPAPSGESNRRSQGSLKEAPSPGGQTPPLRPQRNPSHGDTSTAPPTGTPTETPTGTPAGTPAGTPTRPPTRPHTTPPAETPTGTPAVQPTGTPIVPPTETPAETPTWTPAVQPTGTPMETPTTEPPAAIPVPRPRWSTSSTAIQGDKKTPPARPPPRRSLVVHGAGDAAWGAPNGELAATAAAAAAAAHPGDATRPNSTQNGTENANAASEDECRGPKLASADLSGEDGPASTDVSGEDGPASTDVSGEDGPASTDVSGEDGPASTDVSGEDGPASTDVSGEDGPASTDVSVVIPADSEDLSGETKSASENVCIQDKYDSQGVSGEPKSPSVDASKVTGASSEPRVPSAASDDIPGQGSVAKTAAEDVTAARAASEDIPGQDIVAQVASGDFSWLAGTASEGAPCAAAAAATSVAVAEAASADFQATTVGVQDDAARDDQGQHGGGGSDGDTGGGDGDVTSERKGDAANLSLPPGYLFKVCASHDYEAADMDELSFLEGDVILVLDYAHGQEQDDGWLLGMREAAWTQHRTVIGHSGVFPQNFTTPILP